MTKATPVLLLVVCAAPPAAKVAELAERLRHDDWDVHPVITEAATAWVDLPALQQTTGHPVRSEPRGPQEPKSLPRPDAIIVAPATFNTINQWAAGVHFTATEALRPDTPDRPFHWDSVLDLLNRTTLHDRRGPRATPPRWRQ